MTYLQQAFGNKNPNLPFHPAVRAGDYVRVGPGGQGRERRHAGRHHRTADARHHRSDAAGAAGGRLRPADVVKATVYLEDARDFGRYNGVFKEYFPDGMLAHDRGGPRGHRHQDRDRVHRLQAAAVLNGRANHISRENHHAGSSGTRHLGQCAESAVPARRAGRAVQAPRLRQDLRGHHAHPAIPGHQPHAEGADPARRRAARVGIAHHPALCGQQAGSPRAVSARSRRAQPGRALDGLDAGLAQRGLPAGFRKPSCRPSN